MCFSNYLFCGGGGGVGGGVEGILKGACFDMIS